LACAYPKEQVASIYRAAEKEGVPGNWASGIADSRKPHR
jgi:hypothetical protein